MTGRQPGAVAIVECNTALFKAFDQAVQQHHTRHLLHQHFQFCVGNFLGVHYQRRAAVTHQLFNRLPLFLLIMVTVTNQQKVTGVACHLIHGFNHCAKKGIGDVADNQAERFGRLLRQRACVGIRMILKLLHCLAYGLSGAVAGFGRIIDYTGDCGDRNARQSRNILYGSHALTCFGENVYTSHQCYGKGRTHQPDRMPASSQKGAKTAAVAHLLLRRRPMLCSVSHLATVKKQR